MKKAQSHTETYTLLKVASLNSVAVLVRLVSGFISSKFMAYFVGPEGMALIGNLRDFMRAAQSVSFLGLYNGAVKYISEFKSKAILLSRTLTTLFFLGLLATILTSVFCVTQANLVASYLFPDYQQYSYIIKFIGAVLPVSTLTLFMTSILNGFSKYKPFLVMTIIGQIVGTGVTVFLIFKNQLEGALIALIIVELLRFLILFLGVSKYWHWWRFIKLKNWRYRFTKKMRTYAIMALFSAFVLPLVSIAVRHYLIDTVSAQAAGFWEAMTRISKYYLMFISMILTLYILPRFSEINTAQAFRKEVFGFYKTIIPIFILGLCAIYWLRSFIVSMLFTSEFKPVEALFIWQLLGDLLKVLATVVAYQFLAKNMFWHYMISEFISVSIFYFTSLYCIDLYGAKGATMAYFISYAVYYILVLWLFRRALFGRISAINS